MIRDPEEAYMLIAHRAIYGARAPTNYSPENPSGEVYASAVKELALQGRIRVEVYAKNWRVMELLDGPNAGARTAPLMLKNGKRFQGQPYRITDARMKTNEVVSNKPKVASTRAAARATITLPKLKCLEEK